MSQIKCLSLVAGLGVSLTAVMTASAVTPTTNTDEVRAIVSEMLADAETRSSLLAAGGGGHDGGQFYLADANGNFRLNVGGQIQFRYLVNFRDDNDDTDGPGADRINDDFESGFQTANTRLWFTGNIVDPNLYYAIVGNFSRDGGDFNLEEAYAGYKWDNGFSLQWGQFVLPFLREKLVAQYYQLAADRSLTDITFDQGYSQGIQLGYASEEFRAMFAFSDGFRSANSEFGSVNSGTTGNFGFTGQGGESDWAATLRAEIKFAGNWDQFKDFTSMPESQFAAMLGVAGHIEGSANDITVEGGDPADPADDFQAETTFGGWTVDLSLEGDGWNFYLAGNGAYTNNSASDGNGFDDSFTDYGLVAQGGFFFPDTDWELFARYDGIFADDERPGVADAGDDDSESFSTVTVGTNYYWSGHAAKFTFDVQYFIDNANDGLNTFTNREIGYLGSGEDGEVTLRFQFQLLF